MSEDLVLAIVVTAPFALVLGSFMTVVVDRVPTGGSVVSPRSRCPSCGTQILARDNVPVLGWLLLRGRCRACGARISPLYPLLEISTAVLIVAAIAVAEDLWVGVALAALVGLMPAVAVIDLQHRIIPNRIVYPALVAFPAYLVVARFAGAPVDPVGMILGFALYGGALLLIALVSPRGMGMGDVKLAALIGLVLGAVALRSVGVAAGVGILAGGVAAIVALLSGAGRKSALPFGPFLALGAVVGAFAAEPIANAYLDLLT